MPNTASRRPCRTIIHVNQHVIKQNRATGAQDPPLTIKTYKQTRRASACRIQGPSIVVYRPNHPLACGARVWIETTSPVRITKGA